jgi:ferredoxin
MREQAVQGRVPSGEAQMKVHIDEDACTGCGTCEEICPEIFEVTDEIAVVKIGDEDVPEELEALVREASESCPVEAIPLEE